MYVQERFQLQPRFVEAVRNTNTKFGWNNSGFGEYIYYRHYSRDQGYQEDWYDTAIRVINGVFSIRKDWYFRNYITWPEEEMQNRAYEMARALVRMEWLPPGRGLWAMGSDVVYERGAMPLYNCAFTDIGEDWIEDICWLKDVLMNGVGVGFKPLRKGLTLHAPRTTFPYTVPDTREGWVDSVRVLLRSFIHKNTPLPEFDYSQIRPAGAPIRTFGGTAAGSAPLERLHEVVTDLCYEYQRGWDNYDEITFKTDLANLVGVCVISGNVRRSAEIAIGDPEDPVFPTLKNYDVHPRRAAWGWMSNNSIAMTEKSHFQMLDEVAMANVNGHDVGILNLRNFPHGRIGKHDDVRVDKAHGLNPCGEIPLEHREVCNLAETLPTRCATRDAWLRACEHATFYCSTVALLPTHHASTNAVVARNRRIGVSLIDYTGWKNEIGVNGVVAAMREGYETIRAENRRLAAEAGVPESIRVTTVKPGGTVPKLAGRTSGIGHPTHLYTYRRVNVPTGSQTEQLLMEAGVPHEPSAYTPGSTVFGFPIKQGPAAPATEVSLWEQAMNLVTVQREWADNAVSNTLYFNPDTEVGEVEAVLANIMPYVKSVSLLPHTPEGKFEQMPEEGITAERYQELLEQIKPIDWSRLKGSDGQDEKYCTGEACEIGTTDS